MAVIKVNRTLNLRRLLLNSVRVRHRNIKFFVTSAGVKQDVITLTWVKQDTQINPKIVRLNL